MDNREDQRPNGRPPETKQKHEFAHHQLDVYHVALKLLALARKLARKIPRGERKLADQWTRAARSTVLLIAEGASRRTDGEKAQKYGEARGECGESAAACEVAKTEELITKAEMNEYLELAGRVCAMTSGLVNRYS